MQFLCQIITLIENFFFFGYTYLNGCQLSEMVCLSDLSIMAIRKLVSTANAFLNATMVMKIGSLCDSTKNCRETIVKLV